MSERVRIEIPEDWPSYPEDLIDCGLDLKVVQVDREKRFVIIEVVDE